MNSDTVLNIITVGVLHILGVILFKEITQPYSHKLKRIVLREFKGKYPHEFTHITQTEFVGIPKDSGVQFYFNGNPDSILCFVWSKPIRENQLLEIICDFLEKENFSQEGILQETETNTPTSIRTSRLDHQKTARVILRSPEGVFELHISTGTTIAHSFLLEIKEISST